MGTFLSLCYTAVDTICLILFLDVFEQRRFDGLKFHLHVLELDSFNSFNHCWTQSSTKNFNHFTDRFHNRQKVIYRNLNCYTLLLC